MKKLYALNFLLLLISGFVAERAPAPQIISSAPAVAGEVVYIPPTAFITSGTSTDTSSSQIFLANAHTLKRIFVTYTTVGSGCSTLAVVSLRDVTGASNISSVTLANGVTTTDSGAVSVAMAAGHAFEAEVTTASAGCGAIPQIEVAVTFQ